VTELDALATGIAGAIDGQLVTKWLVLAEVIDSEGARSLQALSSEDLACWDAMGMMAHHSAWLATEIGDD
jgi:hypothetical protein